FLSSAAAVNAVITSRRERRSRERMATSVWEKAYVPRRRAASAFGGRLGLEPPEAAADRDAHGAQTPVVVPGGGLQGAVEGHGEPLERRRARVEQRDAAEHRVGGGHRHGDPAVRAHGGARDRDRREPQRAREQDRELGAAVEGDAEQLDAVGGVDLNDE